MIGDGADRIGDQELLRQPDRETHDAGLEIGERRGPLRQLRGDRPVAHDRTGDELREIDDVERERNGRALRRRDAAIDVDQIGNDVEREERDADRQRDVRAWNLPMPDTRRARR